MSETNVPPAGAGEEGQQGGQRMGPPPPVKIRTQYIKDLSFESPNAPHIYESMLAAQQKGNAPDVKVSVDVRTNAVDAASYEVELLMRGETTVADSQGFIAELTYGGLVDVSDVKKEMIPWLLMVEAPRLLFPFARRILAEVTRDGGFPPLMIAPFDFVELFRRRVEQVKAQQGGQSGDSTPAPESGTA
jgi:preprotein translocase subunit SecB